METKSALLVGADVTPLLAEVVLVVQLEAPPHRVQEPGQGRVSEHVNHEVLEDAADDTVPVRSIDEVHPLVLADLQIWLRHVHKSLALKVPVVVNPAERMALDHAARVREVRPKLVVHRPAL